MLRTSSGSAPDGRSTTRTRIRGLVARCAAASSSTAGTHHGFEEGLGERGRGGEVDRSVDPDDAAVGGSRVAFVRPAVGVDRAVADREAARVGVLDHAGGGLVELGDQRPRGVDVEPVGEGQRRALQLTRVRHRRRAARDRVERAALVRVLAVAELVQVAGRRR